MTLKFFPSVSINWRRAPRRTLLAILGAVTALACADAQEPTPSPSPSALPKLAYIRFWNMLPSQPPKVLELLSADKPLITAPVCNFYAGYSGVAPGSFNLTVRRAGDQNGAIRRFPVNLKADQYITILASNKNGEPGVEYIDDTIDPKLSPPKRLVFRQLFPNAKVTATIDTAPPSAALGYGETLAIENFATAPGSLTIQATIPGQSAKSWSMPLDLSKFPHCTLLVFPDPYGRFRPRLAVDGPSADASAPSGH